MRKVKIITITLLIILMTLISFFGIYLPVQNRMENKVKGYNFSREIDGGRVIELHVATGDDENESEDKSEEDKKETVNSEDLTIENFEIVKKTLEKRLENLGAQDYIVLVNEENGNIIVELAESAHIDTYIYYLTASRKVALTDEESKEKLITDDMIEGAQYTYNADMEGSYKVKVELELNEKGQARLAGIQNDYAILSTEVEEIEAEKEAKKEDKKDKEESEDNTAEENKETEEAPTEESATEDEESSTKPIAKLTIAGTEYDVEKIEDDIITIMMGAETSNSTYINSYISQAAEICMLIESGEIPVEYELYNNRYLYSDTSEEQKMYLAIAISAVLVLILLVFIIKYRVNGLLATISFVGFVSIFLLVIRYTNVLISVEGILAIIISLIINLIINAKILNRIKIMHLVKEAVTGVYKDVFLKIIPIIILTITFCFAEWANLSSFGMIMFWGLALTAIYNILVTKTLLELKENK